MFTPKLGILQPPQRSLWDELRQTPPEFVLYGGTALSLRLGHRHSHDFDFFSNSSFVPESLRKRIQFLQGAEISQIEANTLTAIVDRNGPVKVSFVCGLALNRVYDPEITEDNKVRVPLYSTSQQRSLQRFNSERKREITKTLPRLLRPG